MAALFVAAFLAACSVMPDAPAGDSRAQVMATERFREDHGRSRPRRLCALHRRRGDLLYRADAPARPARGGRRLGAFLRGRAKAPFSWQPDTVEVLAGGSLALSSGPVHDPDGKLVSRFTSIWRRTPAGEWEIVFDKCNEVCDCKTLKAALVSLSTSRR